MKIKTYLQSIYIWLYLNIVLVVYAINTWQIENNLEFNNYEISLGTSLILVIVINTFLAIVALRRKEKILAYLLNALTTYIIIIILIQISRYSS